MVKSYLRYVERTSFGVVASPEGGCAFLDPHKGRLLAVPALEKVAVWDAKTASRTAEWTDGDVKRAEATCVAVAGQTAGRLQIAAVGYSDGSIRLFDTSTNSLLVVLNGHRAAVTTLVFDAATARLASGAKDTDVILWDVVAETGLFRLRGHKNLITGLAFIVAPAVELDDEADTTMVAETRSESYLVSSSTDSLLKMWDLSTQHCIETVVAHRSELWAFSYNPRTGFLYSGAADPELKMWKVDLSLIPALESRGSTQMPLNDDGTTALRISPFIPLGAISRRSKERVAAMRIDPTGSFLGVQAADKTVEVISLLDLEEVKKRLARRRRRNREKDAGKKAKGKEAADDGDEGLDPNAPAELNAATHLRPLTLLTLPARVRGFDLAMPKPTASGERTLMLAATLANNSIEVYSIHPPPTEKEPSSLAYAITLPGHRSDIRSIALSSDAALILSGASDGAKVWNAATSAPIRTLTGGYVTCCTFIPGDKHVLLGLKTGGMELWELPGNTLLESFEAHEATVWGMQVRPDRRGVATCSADKTIKFWDFGFVEVAGKKNLTLNHIRTLKLSDDVLALGHSPSQAFIACSLLDSTVKIFRHDTLKFHLSLYGHKLPVLSLDISSDNTLIVTGGSDKSVKIWGMDFGDCHKSLLAHEGGVTSVKWVWGTHYLWTVGRDGLVKYWDCDKFELIQQLNVHHSEVWCLAVAPHGRFLATGSHDRSIRIFERTDSQLFLEEERERDLEEVEEAEAAKESRNEGAIGSGVPDALGNLPEVEGEEAGKAGKRTGGTLKAGEEIMEALDVWEDDTAKAVEAEKTGSARSRNPYIEESGDPDMEAERYVLKVIESIRSAELEEALLVLPFARVSMLLAVVCVWVERGWNVPLTSRILLYLMRTHYNQLIATRLLRPVLGKIQKGMKKNLERQKSIIGFNLAALKFGKSDWVSSHSGISDLVEGESAEPEKEEPQTKGVKRAGNKRKRIVLKS